jgi:4-hydroxy 2-oxovalerate aldolase
MINNALKILDCTLRDGGYYNDWDFSDELVGDYLTAINNSGIDAVEIGFRFLPKSKFIGSLGYSTDEYLSSLNLPLSCLVGVMINAKEILNFEDGIDEAISKLFDEKKNSPVDLVRVAAHFNEYSDCYPIVKALHSLGYIVGFNLMQSGGRSEKELSDAAAEIKSWKGLEVLYFADSLGNMSKVDVLETIDAFRSGGWERSIGIHTHDNMTEALNNSLAAIDHGAQWIDATIMGMGRGPGNAKMEYLLIELEKSGYVKYNPKPLFPIALDQFSNLQSKYGWGSNILYYLSAEYGIHPTYVQEMTAKIEMDANQKIEAVEFLGASDSTGYNPESLNQAFLNEGGSKEGAWSCKNWLKSEDIMIIGPGKSTKKYNSAIINYINAKKPKVISLNINKTIPPDCIDAYAACHHMRVMMDVSKYSELEKPLIIPMETIDPTFKAQLQKINILDYGLQVKEDNFEFTYNGCVIPKPLVFLYTLALVHSSGANRVLLVGFDGYSQSDPRQIEMDQVISKYKEQDNSLDLVALTPSSYAIEQSSIYNLNDI